MDSKTYCLVPVFGPALAKQDFVIDYIQHVVSKKKVKTTFQEMYKSISDPVILTNSDMWNIILEIIDNFWYPDARPGFNNPIWGFFERADAELLQKLTGFMLRHYESTIMTMMEHSSGLERCTFVHSKISSILQRMLSWAWIPVLIRLNTQNIHESFRPISRDVFFNYRDHQIVLPKQTTFDIWGVKSAWKAAAMNTISAIQQFEISWDDYQRFIHSVVMDKKEIASSLDGDTSAISLDSLHSSIHYEHSIAQLQSEESGN